MRVALVGAALAAVVWSAAASAGPSPEWRSAASMPERRSYFAAAAIAGKIYVSGGMVGASGTYVARLERFNPLLNQWRRLPDQPRLARAAAGAAYRNSLYVIGGQTPSKVTRRVLAYHPRTHRWSSSLPLPVPRYNAAAAALGGKLYVAGGVRGFDPVRTVFVFDGQRWSTAAPLPQALHTEALVVFRKELWSIGGFDRNGERVRSVWIYSPSTNRWRAGPRLVKPLAMVGATAAGGEVYAVSEDVFERYVPGHGWVLGPQLRVPRHALGLFAVDQRLWAVGGCVVPQLADSRVVETRPLG
ncbi:MAG: hypothetical protein QOG85_2517 [Gaiellaceae bacterium]|jgi:N-acetylneuraminic acid mutarotase|nr:hypothetical protein [Gaiellaceae bacterium]